MLHSELVGVTQDTESSIIKENTTSLKTTYKYILIEMRDQKTNDRQLLVRGSENCKYHSEILDAFNCK